LSDAEFSITVSPADAGLRLDAYLAASIAAVSRARIQRAIANGEVTVNDTETKSSYKVRAGDAIQVELPSLIPLEAAAEPIPIEILFEDEQVIVINKPAGMVVHPGAGVSSGTLANALVYHFEQLAQGGGPLRPGIVHRLDVGTSGIMVVAKTEGAHNDLSQQFADRRVAKSYVALVYGSVATKEGRIDAPVGRDPRNRVRMAVRPESGRPALTYYRVQERFEEFTLLDVGIKTGRTHQIRVHLAHIKHPVVGDATYDSGRGKNIRDAKLRSEVAGLGRPFLHAGRLGFSHPTTGEAMSLSAPMPEELEEFLEMLRGR
jgi:23S rRNA pseudouridine1911/1915/1917 synthase